MILIFDNICIMSFQLNFLKIRHFNIFLTMSHLVCLDFEQVHIFSQGPLHFKKSRFLLSLFIIIFL
jgi:hypothetical protein